MPKPRDWVARSPLMRKGGPHIKSKTGQRVRARLDLNDALCEWYEEDEPNINEQEKTNGEPMAPRNLFLSVISGVKTNLHYLLTFHFHHCWQRFMIRT